MNYLRLTNAATGASPAFTATGADANVGINLVPKGTGTVQQAGVPVVTTTGTQTLTNKTVDGYVAGSQNGTAANLTLWTGTQAQYDAIGSKSSTTVYVIS